MKLIFVLTAVLALTLAEEDNIENIADSEAAASIEILKEGVDLNTAASAYNYVPQNQWQPPQNTWEPPKQTENNYHQPGNVQNYWTTNAPPHHHIPTTTTPVPVIKNEQYIGDNGNYHYEYQIGDGTHVGEQGWFSSPTKEEDSAVKKGWYSFVGADGITYTVTYWADKTGYHAYGNHLPTPPPVPAAIQAALDKENNKPQYDYPTQTVAPQPAHPTRPSYVPTQATFAPTRPPYTPTHPTYNPGQQPIYTQPQQPTYNPPQKPTYNPTQQPTYNPSQQPTYNPPQQPTYNPPQQPSYNPPQQTYYPPQQSYYPQQQQTYYPQQQNTYVPQYNV